MTDYHRKNPYLAKLKERKLLTPLPSTRKTYHIELDIKEAKLNFSVGDSIGIYPSNPKEVVDKILNSLKISPEEKFFDKRSNQTFSYRVFLTKKCNLNKIPSSILHYLCETETNKQKREQLSSLQTLENKDKKKQFLQNHEIWDLLEEYPQAHVDPQTFCEKLLPMMPRFYSIASSPKIHPNEIHLTVACVEYETNSHKRVGVASYFLTETATVNETEIPLYIQPAKHFRLPQNANIPVIMIGPGTGIAPYRGFLQERAVSSAKNWLFFGERNQNTDFYYGSYFEKLASENKLQLDLAFSRDQEKKVYVQDRMLEKAEELWQWIKKGAHIFVCGDAQKMAKDVDKTLVLIAQNQGKMPEEEARRYIKDLRLEKRYLLDVY